MKNAKIDAIRKEIIELLQIDFPSKRTNSNSNIDWGEVEKEYKDDPIFKKATLQRFLGVLSDENTRNSTKYENLQSLQKIKSIIEGNYRKQQGDIKLVSSNTTNFLGFYLILSPSSLPGMLNLFPLEIFSNGDFELNYVHPGDIIRGITSYSTNHISLYANRKYNSTTQSHIDFFLHSVFNVQSSSSRNDLKPFSLGVATRRKRKSDGLKAVMELLIKIEKPLFDAFGGTALTLEKDKDTGIFHLLRETMEYLEEHLKEEFLQYKIKVDARASQGKITLIEKDLKTIFSEFYDFLVADEDYAINLEEQEFKRLSDIENRLRSIGS